MLRLSASGFRLSEFGFLSPRLAALDGTDECVRPCVFSRNVLCVAKHAGKKFCTPHRLEPSAAVEDECRSTSVFDRNKITPAANMERGTDITRLMNTQGIMRNPSPGDACPPLLTKFGSGGRDNSAITQAITTPSKGPNNSAAIAPKTLGIALTSFMELVIFAGNADPFLHLIEIFG